MNKEYNPTFKVGDEAHYCQACTVAEVSTGGFMVKVKRKFEIEEGRFHPASGFLKGPLYVDDLGNIVEDREALIKRHREELSGKAKMTKAFYDVLKLFSMGYGSEDEKRAIAHNLMEEYFTKG